MKSLGAQAGHLRKMMLMMWAFAVLWLYIGNLVNFHQHHIWGKQLLPVACTSTRTKEKVITLSVDGQNSYHFAASDALFAAAGATNTLLPAVRINFQHHIQQKPVSGHIFCWPMRGPPLA